MISRHILHLEERAAELTVQRMDAHVHRVIAIMLLLATVLIPSPVQQSQAASSLPSLHVAGNHIIDSAGQPVQLRGVNRSGTQYACVEGWGVFDGPVDDAAITVMAAWGINAVRVSLNEHCWLGINGVPAATSGAAYQNAIADFVARLNNQDIYVILDLHWNAPGTRLATGQQAMADRDHSPEFWRQVAARFKDNGAVLFDLYNEPHPDYERDSTEAWRCWRDGGTCAGVAFQVAGMQEMVDAVRSTGARNIVIANGVRWGNRLTRWLEYRPFDPTGNLAAGWHSYHDGLAECDDSTTSCLDAKLGAVVQQFPIVATEIGQFDCRHGHIEAVMSWLDRYGQSYTAWAWIPSGCTAEPALIADWNGTPTQTYGQGVKDHLARLASAPAPTATATGMRPPTATTVPTSGSAIGAHEFRATVDATAQARYGLSYPLTYVFSLPAGLSGLRAEVRYGTSEAWSALPTRAATDRFSGVAAARFTGTTAVLSVPFRGGSEHVYLRIVDSAGTPVPTTFLRLARYYDDRVAAVTITLDDVGMWSLADFTNAVQLLAQKGLPHSVGIVTRDLTPDGWATVQGWVDAGATEAASHTETHPCSDHDYAAEGGITAQVVGSRDDILANLRVPDRYVRTFIEPCGYSSPEIVTATEAAGYLVVRSAESGVRTLSALGAHGAYGRTGVTYDTWAWPSGATDPAWRDDANAAFDRAYTSGGVYHLMDHPWQGRLFPGSALEAHTSYIAGRADVWYVSFGSLYEYHYLASAGKVTVVAGAATATPTPTPTPTPAPSSAITAPAALTASRSGPPQRQHVTLTWVDTTSAEAGFVIERATDAGFTSQVVTFVVPADSTAYRDQGVQRWTTYYYRVAAVDAARARSKWSNTATVTTR